MPKLSEREIKKGGEIGRLVLSSRTKRRQRRGREKAGIAKDWRDWGTKGFREW